VEAATVAWMAKQYGTPGGSLQKGRNSWASSQRNAQAGLKGEQRCAAMLAKLPDNVVVIHDVKIPGSAANVDHVIVVGRKVFLVDAKLWRPEFFWSAFGMSFSGWKRFALADKKTMLLALSRFKRSIPAAKFAQPKICVLTSDARRPANVTFLRVPGCHALNEKDFERFLRKIGRRKTKADPEIVRKIVRFAHQKPRRRKQRPAK
jgi:hypothetical protein